MRHRAILLALSLGATLLAGPPAAHAADACPDPDDHIHPGWLFPHGNPPNGRDGDPFAMSPGNTTLGLADGALWCRGVSVTVERPDGSGSHQALLDQYIDGAGVNPTQYGYDTFDYATGTGPWRITKATYGGVTVDLTTPAEFRMTRGSVLTLAATPGALPSGPRVSGTVKYWTYQGVQAPSPGRTVWIRKPDTLTYPYQRGPIIATTTTDSAGRYAVTLPIHTNQDVVADVPGTTTLGFTFYGPVRATVYQPTFLTGRAAPTTATVIRPGTRMSTYGHLSVVYTTGKTGPFANQRVLVQTRPRSNPSAPYSTVGSDVTSSTGYYYTNWNASVDVDVRVAFITPYQSIASSYRWLRVVDVT
jgi:hypothetical protein